MSYFLSSDPIPQNSLLPPPAWKGQASDARRQANFDFSRTGRERLYANLPTGADFLPLSPDLAACAQGMINASDAARQTVLNGVGDDGNTSFFTTIEADLASIITNAPQVFSLNGSNAVAPAQANTGSVSASGGNATVFPTMPARAPQDFRGTWIHPTGPTPTKSVSAKQRQVAPPGCGMSGFSPAWGDAYTLAQASTAGSGGTGLGWLLLAAAGVGLLAMRRKGR